jgi:tripartite-type tricarboxylate transporter receptor subunit TctC
MQLKCMWQMAGLAMLAVASGARAQGYPAQGVRLVVPFAAGGSTDAIARIVAEKLSDSLGKQVLVDNKPGAAGAIGADNVAKSKPDGYTLLLATTSTHAVLPVVNAALPYAQKDFVAISLLAKAPNVLAASPSVKANNVKELIALARSQPGRLTFASSGTGTITHLVGERFRAEAGIDVTHVPYKTGVQALADLVSGQVSYVFDSIVWTLPQIRAAKLKGLAVTTLNRSPLAPDLPTVAETLPGFEGITWFGLVAPAGTPPDVVSRLNADVRRALQDESVKERFGKQGIEAAQGTPEDFNALIQSDTVKWRDLIRKTGVKIE